jgi:hypothetical protein
MPWESYRAQLEWYIVHLLSAHSHGRSCSRVAPPCDQRGR